MADDDDDELGGGCGCLVLLAMVFVAFILIGAIGWAWKFMWTQWGY